MEYFDPDENPLDAAIRVEKKLLLYDDLTALQKSILEKELEIESIKERLEDLKSKPDADYDDVHKATVKYRAERTRLTKLKCKEVEVSNNIKALYS